MKIEIATIASVLIWALVPGSHVYAQAKPAAPAQTAKDSDALKKEEITAKKTKGESASKAKKSERKVSDVKKGDMKKGDAKKADAKKGDAKKGDAKTGASKGDYPVPQGPPEVPPPPPPPTGRK